MQASVWQSWAIPCRIQFASITLLNLIISDWLGHEWDYMVEIITTELLVHCIMTWIYLLLYFVKYTTFPF